MSTPTPRFLIPASVAHILETKALAQVATIGPRSEPQVSPVWFHWDGEHILFSQTKTRQKLRNAQRDPRIAICIVDPDDLYNYVELRGTVVRIEEDRNNKFID